MQPDESESIRERSPGRAPVDGEVGREACGRPQGEPARLSKDAQLVRFLFKSLGDPPVRVSLWNGESLAPGAQEAVAHVRIASRAALLKLIVDPAFQFGECYCDRSVEVDGNLVDLFEVLLRALADNPWSARQLIDWSRRRRANTPGESRENIHSHYDLGNSFYELWLDPQLAYTCAYFPHPGASLAEAQVAKMDHVCAKLRLRPGESVVEAGCGWGALALHMATRFGVNVRAFNISREQMVWARARAHAMGVEKSVEFIEDDYRNIGGGCDAFVSVGMLEHVGHENYREFGRVIDRVLGRNGRGLIHSIGLARPEPLNAWIERRIFPGAYPPSLREMLEVLEGPGFAVLDVENLRLHYALTLKHWLERFETASDKVAGMYDERFVRAWRLYLSGSRAAFNSGRMQLFQVLFAREHCNEVPWTRDYLYRR